MMQATIQAVADNLQVLLSNVAEFSYVTRYDTLSRIASRFCCLMWLSFLKSHVVKKLELSALLLV
jgi:hypothetical protein